MAAIKPEQKIYLFISIFILLFLLLFFLPILSLIQRLKEVNFQITEQRQESFAIGEEEAEIKKAVNVMKGLDKEKISGFLVPKENVLKIIVNLENIAKKTNNLIEITTKSSDISQEERANIVLQISLWGDFPGLIDFLNDLENGSYLSQIQNMEIQKISEQESASKKINFPEGASIKSALTLKIFLE